MATSPRTATPSRTASSWRTATPAHPRRCPATLRRTATPQPRPTPVFMQRWWSGLHYPPRPPHPGDERRWLRPPASLARIRPWQPGRPADPEARGLAQTQWFAYIWDLHHSWRIAGRPWSLQVISSVGYSDCRHDGLHPLLPPNIQKLSKMRSLRSGVKGLDTKQYWLLRPGIRELCFVSAATRGWLRELRTYRGQETIGMVMQGPSSACAAAIPTSSAWVQWLPMTILQPPH